MTLQEGRRGHADASAVGAGKTLTALATIVRLAAHIEASGAKRYGCAEKGLQDWVRENAWKRRGLLGRIGLFVPLE